LRADESLVDGEIILHVKIQSERSLLLLEAKEKEF